MSTTKGAVATEPRLTALGRRIDSLQDKARGVSADARATANRRVDDIRAREAEVRTRAHAFVDAIAAERGAELDAVDAGLAEIADQIDIADAELDAEMAEDAGAFVAAAERGMAAWDAYLDRLDERADAAEGEARERLHTSVARARALRVEAGRRLQDARQAPSDGWAAARKGVRQAFDDLDWASEQAATDIARYFE